MKHVRNINIVSLNVKTELKQTNLIINKKHISYTL